MALGRYTLLLGLAAFCVIVALLGGVAGALYMENVFQSFPTLCAPGLQVRPPRLWSRAIPFGC